MLRTAAALFSAALILPAASVQAQAQVQPDQSLGVARTENIAPGGQQKTATITIAHLPGCPVSMQAKQGGLTSLVKTGQMPPEPQQYDPMPKASQHIHLILGGFGKDKSVASAIVTARGLSARGRIDRAADTAGTAGLRRTMSVPFFPDEDGTVTADLILPAFTSVSSIQLESITYSDGSDWKLADNDQCRIGPDPVMLIAAHEPR